MSTGENRDEVHCWQIRELMLCWFQQVLLCLGGGVGGVGKRKGAHQHFCHCRSLAKIPAPPGQTLRLVKKSLSSTSQIFSNCCLHAVAPSWGCLLYCLLKGRDSISYHPLGSSRTEPTDF